MDTIKIRGKQGIDKVETQIKRERVVGQDQGSDRSISGGVVDRLDIGISKLIREQLNPDVIAAERRKKVEEVKAKLAGGHEYDSELVAVKAGMLIDEEVDGLKILSRDEE